MSRVAAPEGPPVRLLLLWGALLGGLAAATRIRAYDFFWHLETGRWIVEHGAVPRSDPFSFTAAGVPWVDHSWLYQAALFALYRAAGLAGPWLLKVVAGAAIGAALALGVRRDRLPAAAGVLLVLVAIRGAAFRFTDRPEMLTLLFVVLAAALLTAPPASASFRTRALAYAALCALWANVHAGALLGPLLAGAAAVAEAAAWLLRRRPERLAAAARLGGLAALAGVALLANPYGLRLLGVPATLARILREPWAQNPEWTRPRVAEFPWLYLAAGLILAALLLRPSRVAAGTGLGIAGAALALTSVRHIGVFFVLLPVAIAPWLAGLDGRMRRLTGRWAAPAVAAAGLAWMAAVPVEGSLGTGLEPGRFPERACDFLQQEEIGGKWFHEVAFGGYVLHRFPGRPLFIDGRNEIYPEVLRRIYEGQRDPARFWSTVDDWGIDVALLRYPPAPQLVRYAGGPGEGQVVERSWSEVFFPASRWALVYWDDVAMVRVRREAFDPAWVRSREWTLNPDDWTFLRSRIAAGRLDPEVVAADLERKRTEDPGCRRAASIRDDLARLLSGASGRREK